MRRCMVVAVALILAACSSDLTAPEPVPEPRTALGSAQIDSYAAAPCAAGITSDLAAWRGSLGDPSAIVAGVSGDTSWVRVEFPAPAQYADYYGGVVWQEYWYLSGWTYCMATRSIGMPSAYE